MTEGPESEASLLARLAALRLPGTHLGCRLITPGDEDALLPAEAANFTGRALSARRASGAGRVLARVLLERLGFDAQPLRRLPSGAPDWPRGVVGSLSHDDSFAVAIVGPRESYASLGIDIEPAEDLPPGLIDLVATTRERNDPAWQGPAGGRVLFSVKEAVYKAVHPLDGMFLDYQDVEVDLENRTARVLGRRHVEIRVSVTSRILSLAFVRVS